MPRLRAVLTLDEHLQVCVLESQFPPPLAFVLNSEGDAGMRRVQKRGGNTKVPENPQGLMQPRKPAQRIALSKIRHARSRTIGSCAALFPDSLPRATGIVWDAPNTETGGVLDPMWQYRYSQLPYTDWCHTASDGPLSELHQMAEKMGLCHAWLHNAPIHPQGARHSIRRGALDWCRAARCRCWARDCHHRRGRMRNEHAQQHCAAAQAG
jgi:hypothetical protein